VATPDFVVVGHVVRDLVPEGWRLGGTATFAAVQAERLGLSVGIVTRVGPDLDLGIGFPNAALAVTPSPQTTTFQNEYSSKGRTQHVRGRADIVSPADVPSDWRTAPIALLGPVCSEVASDMSSSFNSELLGVSAQGWLRQVDSDGLVRGQPWDGEPFWRNCHVLFVSDEDVGARTDQVDRWIDALPVVAVTSNREGARVHHNKRWQSIPAFPAREVDPTGAGDVFATAFLVELRATGDVARSARFASAAAACSIEAVGVEAIAKRDQIEERMQAHQEVVLA
jgi:hypothetical protein